MGKNATQPARAERDARDVGDGAPAVLARSKAA